VSLLLATVLLAAITFVDAPYPEELRLQHAPTLVLLLALAVSTWCFRLSHLSFSPAQAEAYNGQQGDVWDPQKDLALAWFGAVISAGLVFRKRWAPQPDDGS
jgi:uncharacterized membrane protein YjdF